jgi:hypothetical protein
VNNADSLTLFEKIKVLADINGDEANELARTSGLAVKTPHHGYGVLTGVDMWGLATVECAGRSRRVTERFSDLEPTGHVVES